MTFRLGETLPRWGFEMSTSALDLRESHNDDVEEMAGILFGSSAAMLQTTARQRERRNAFADLLAGLTRALDRRNDISLMRGAFEELMRRVVPVRTIQLREAGSRWALRVDASGAESFAVEVPGADPVNTGVLEATFDPASGLGEWDFQMLGLAAHLGALVLEIERSRLQLVRAGLWTTTRVRRDGAAPLIGSTPIMEALRASIERVAVTDFTVLLEGESGVGKELVARQIHELSRRRNGPFIAVNCAAVVETLLEAELFGIEDRTATGVRGRRGKFEAADGGTLFLDEVSDLSLSAQAKLLRAIQDLAIERVGSQGAHRVDIRIVAATNRALAGLVERGLFRPDLFYRLSGVDVRVPTLRERRPDVMELAHYFLQRHRDTRLLKLSAVAAQALVNYDWPGNVRELERLIERAVALAESDVIELDDLPPTVRADYAAALGPSLRRNDTLRTWASRYARLILDRCQDNKREACRVLGISYHTLQAYLRYPAGDPAWVDLNEPAEGVQDESCLDAEEEAV
jgi:DNA-binding NtrC family response regulator